MTSNPVSANLSAKKIAVLTTMNTVCGIAEYSRDLYTPLISQFSEFHFIANRDVADRTRPDTKEVLRLWEYGEQEFKDTLDWLAHNTPDYFHIQLHTANHFPLSGLTNLLRGVQAFPRPPKVIVTPHSVRSNSFDLAEVKSELAQVDAILVHKQQDYDYLTSHGLHNVILFPHPFDTYPQRDRQTLRQSLEITHQPVVVTHGLISEHKGLVQMTAAVAQLRHKYPQLLWLAVNAVNINNITSAGTLQAIQSKIAELNLENNVRLFTDFLSSEEVLLLIQAADVGICAYSEVGESASAAVRKFLASGVPTIVTDIPMMQELGDEVLKIKNNDPAMIAAGISALLENAQLAQATAQKALHKSHSLSWKVMGEKLQEIYSSL